MTLLTRANLKRAGLHGDKSAAGEIADKVTGLHDFGARAVEGAESAIRHPYDDLRFADFGAGRVVGTCCQQQKGE